MTTPTIIRTPKDGSSPYVATSRAAVRRILDVGAVVSAAAPLLTGRRERGRIGIV
jgi:hypothetical protein